MVNHAYSRIAVAECGTDNSFNKTSEVSMTTVKQAGVKRLKMSERAQQKFELHFPGFNPLHLWRRKLNDGYTTLPRTLPYAMQAIDAQSKGQPAGHTLFCLWARSPDHPFLTIENPATFAAEAGFSGERTVDTWRRRMKRLQALGFLMAKKGPAGDFHYVLLLNPNMAMENMWQQKLIQTDLYSRFVDRLDEVGGSGEIQAFRAEWNPAAAAQQAGGPATPTVPPSPPAAGPTAGPSAQVAS
jgi:hypothetical protein